MRNFYLVFNNDGALEPTASIPARDPKQAIDKIKEYGFLDKDILTHDGAPELWVDLWNDNSEKVTNLYLEI